MITAVTTCKGRLDHLETTLPLMLEEFDRVIVVDWDCPQHSGDWAVKEGASVVYKRNEPFFDAARARNFGARDVMSRKVCFIDADTMVFPGLKAEIESLLKLETMILAPRNAEGFDISNLLGFIAVDIGQFWGVGGYDENFNGYALEDVMLRAQLLVERNIQPVRVGADKLGAIQHSNELRGQFHREPIEDSSKRNHTAVIAYLKSKGIDGIPESIIPKTRESNALRITRPEP